MTKMVPFTFPMITSYPGVCNTLAIISHDLDYTAPWIYDRYLQLMAAWEWETENQYYGTFYEEQIGVPARTECPFIKALVVDKETLYGTKDILDFFKHYIINGYIIDVFVDHFYISCNPSYQNEHYLHPILINGFSDEEAVFYVSDFFNGKYVTNAIPYDELRKSYYNSMGSDKLYSQTIGMNRYQRMNYDLDLELIKTSLEDYLNCRDSFSKYAHSLYLRGKKILFGLDYYKAIEETVKYYTTSYIDYRIFHVLFDHKKMMKHRLEYFYRSQLLKDSAYSVLMEKCTNNENSSLQLRNLVLKYNMASSSELLLKIENASASLRALDEDMEYYLLNQLSCI